MCRIDIKVFWDQPERAVGVAGYPAVFVLNRSTILMLQLVVIVLSRLGRYKIVARIPNHGHEATVVVLLLEPRREFR